MAAPPRLSVVSFTNGPIAMSAASLARVRDLAAEIVVAVDSRVDPDTLGPLQDIADRVARAEFTTPAEANLAWLDSLASGDWVLHLDTDEVVSDALRERLATPRWDDGITHARVSRRWCWPTPAEMLDEWPWWPDPVLRLFRTTPGITRYTATVHAGREVVGDHRFIDEPLYHLKLVARSVAERVATVEQYEREAPGLRTDRGWAVNGAYYLPEERPVQPRTTPIPAADARAIDAVLAAMHTAVPRRRPARALEVVTVAERRAPLPAPGEVALRLVEPAPVRVVAGLATTILIGFTNRSARRMSPHDTPPPLVGTRVRDPDNAPFPELRAPLPGPVAPGEEVLVPLGLPAIFPVGTIALEVGAVQEFIAWYDARCEVVLDVRRGRRIVLLADDGDGADSGRGVVAAVARARPDVILVPMDGHGRAPDGWPESFDAVVTLGETRASGSSFLVDARRAGIPIVAGSHWDALAFPALRDEINRHLGPPE